MLAPLQMTSASRQNLWRLTFIRILVLAAQAGSVGLAYWFNLLPLPWLQLAITLVCSSVLCALTAIRLRTSWPVTELEYAVQLAGDLFIHSALLYFSGGSTNPFVSYYLVPLTIAAVTLPWRFSLILSGIALALYTLLLARFYPLETFPIAREKPADLRHVAEFRPGRGGHHVFLPRAWPRSCVARKNCGPSAVKRACATSNCWPWRLRPLAPPMSWARRWRP
nr:hypothetical protein GCM10020185_20050 [Pseudomonas brassicacearum subsp. brassicacearum]